MVDLKNEKKQLEAELEDKEKLLKAEKDAVVTIREELERHAVEYAFLDNDLLSKFRMCKTYAKFCLFPFL